MPDPQTGAQNLRAEFVPMVWSDYFATKSVLDSLVRNGYKTLLTFNEPDSGSQANMTVAQAIQLWPQLMATGLRLGSPATTTGAPWLDDFMTAIQKNGYRVDFLALHWYDDINDPNAITNLRDYLTGYWNRYHLPIWLTEFSGAHFDYFPRAPTFDDNARFARDSVLLLESLPFVERYAWFSSKVDLQCVTYATTGLYWDAQNASVVGVAYRDTHPVVSSCGP
jgi:hypothetical protein